MNITGAYDSEEAAARTYDLAALKYWGPTTILNFPVCDTTTILCHLYLFILPYSLNQGSS